MRSTKSPSWISGLGGEPPRWARLLGFEPVPVPPYVFLLDAHRLRYGQFVRERQGWRFFAGREVGLPLQSFQPGLLGGPLRDPHAFGELVAGFVRELPSPVREASLVLPDAWLRVIFSESADLPGSAEQRDDVLRWKLRRMVPFRVDELRIDAVEVSPVPGQEEPRRLLLGFAVEQLLAQIETAFDDAGVRIGHISNESLALLAAVEAPGTGGFWGLVLAEEEGYTLVFAHGGEPVLHRFKGLSAELPEAARTSLVQRDLRLTRNFLEELFPSAVLGPVLLVAAPEDEPLWLDRLADGLGRPAVPLDGRHLPSLRSAEGRVPPMRELAAMVGAARREVA